MKSLQELLAAIQGNVKTKINDPIIGTFFCSWVLCNWDKLAVLFLGEKPLEARIKYLSVQMGFIQNPKLLLSNYDLLILPLILTCFYVFLMPRVSVRVAQLLSKTEISRHSEAVDIEVKQAQKQRELNVEKLRGDPN
mgnify:CR=1 FL=1